MPTAAERVAQGVAILDARYTPVWVDRISLEKLDMGDSCWCILGQLEGSFSDAVEELRPFYPGDDGWVTSFAIYERTTNELLIAAYDELTTEWRRVIAERRAARAVRLSGVDWTDGR